MSSVSEGYRTAPSYGRTGGRRTDKRTEVPYHIAINFSIYKLFLVLTLLHSRSLVIIKWQRNRKF